MPLGDSPNGPDGGRFFAQKLAREKRALAVLRGESPSSTGKLPVLPGAAHAAVPEKLAKPWLTEIATGIENHGAIPPERPPASGAAIEFQVFEKGRNDALEFLLVVGNVYQMNVAGASFVPAKDKP